MRGWLIASVMVTAVVVIAGAQAAPSPPKATITSGPSGRVASTSASFSFRSNQNGSSFQCKLDAGSYVGCTSPRTYSGLAQGAHTFSVRASSSNGTGAPATASWTVDTVAPPTPTIGSFPADPTSSTSGAFAFSDTEAGVTYRCSLDNAAAISCGSSYTVTGLHDGLHTLSVRARDAAGNLSGPATTSWHVDATPPPVPKIDTQSFDTSAANATFGFSDSEAGVTFLCSVDGASGQSCTSPQAVGPLADGDHSFSVVAVDALGNTSGAAQTGWTTGAPTTQWLSNGNFENGLTGWGAGAAGLTLVNDGNQGPTAVKVAQAGTPTEYYIYATPRPVLSTVAGTAYTVTGSLRSATPGKQVCLRIREYQDTTSNNRLGEQTSCATTSSTWSSFTPLVYTAVGSGHTLAFQVFQPAATVTTGDSFEVDGLSITSPASGGVSGPVVAAVGDIACAPNDPNYNNGNGTGTKCMQAATANLVGSMTGLSSILLLGDQQYQCGELANFNSVFAPTWGRFKSLERPAAGNHEYGDTAACSPSNAAGYYAYFGSAAGDPTKGYYSFDIGSWHIVTLNSNCAAIGGCGAGSAQELWLKNDLATHPTSCTLAYWHHPRFSAGQTGDDPRTAALWNDLVAGHVDLALAGHDHTYQRFAPMDANGSASATGVREIVVGTGGEEHHTIPLARPTLQVGDNTTFGVLKLTLGTSGYSGQFVPAPGTGSFTDSFSGSCV